MTCFIRCRAKGSLRGFLRMSENITILEEDYDIVLWNCIVNTGYQALGISNLRMPCLIGTPHQRSDLGISGDCRGRDDYHACTHTSHDVSSLS